MDKNRRTTALRRSSHLVLAVLLLFVTSCERYIRYPRETWSNFDSSASKRWRVKTSDEIYLARRVATTDSTVVIEELSENDEQYKVVGRDDTSPPQSHDNARAVVMPIVLSFDEVTSIERIGHNRVKEGFLVVGIILAAWVTFAVVYFLLEGY